MSLGQKIQLSGLVSPPGERAGGMSPAHCGREAPEGDDQGGPRAGHDAPLWGGHLAPLPVPFTP